MPLSDLQGAIGKDGSAGIASSVSSLTAWARRDPFLSEQVALNAVKTIVLLAPRKSGESGDNIDMIGQAGVRDIDTAQYGIITVFLCHVVLWVFSGVSPIDKKQRLLDLLGRDREVRTSWFMSVLERGLGVSGTDGNFAEDAPKILFRSAAEMLTRLGTWGASLNLALLMHKRSEM